ncbi:hypothetical protein LSH36_94g04014 [Paralvinella palmiformis]|uniref:Uncharacterized protein n=1 Tax=Paralvinella palmiformis TaxID=53620 RepID=A0AAD9K1H2_9ANNE|nr:hypothetical protein LSH36_94g04014 [Paralvinella palmiformis]
MCHFLFQLISVGRLYTLFAIWITVDGGSPLPVRPTESSLLYRRTADGINELNDSTDRAAFPYYYHYNRPAASRRRDGSSQRHSSAWSPSLRSYAMLGHVTADVIGSVGVRSWSGGVEGKRPSRRVRVSRAGRTGRAAQGPFFSEKTRLRFLNALRQFEETKDGLKALAPGLRQDAAWRLNALDEPTGGDKGAALSIGLDLRALTEMLEGHRKQQTALQGVHQKLIDIG